MFALAPLEGELYACFWLLACGGARVSRPKRREFCECGFRWPEFMTAAAADAEILRHNAYTRLQQELMDKAVKKLDAFRRRPTPKTFRRLLSTKAELS